MVREGNHPTLAGMQRALREKWNAATVGGPLTLRFDRRRLLDAKAA